MQYLRNIVIISILAASALSRETHAAELNILGLPEDKKTSFISKLSPRLDFITRRTPSPWRADDASFFLERLLIRDGYAEAEVSWSLPGNNTITLNAEPGLRYQYGHINAPNFTALSQSQLYQYFLQPLVDTELVDINKAPYIAEYSEQGASNVNNYLKSQGFWNSRVNIHSEQPIRNTKKVDITLSIITGNKLLLNQPIFQGTSSEHISILSSKIRPYLNQAATTKNINLIKKAVDDFYRENGYQFAKVQMQSNHGEKTTNLVFNIISGKKYNVRKVIVRGHEKTKKRRIRRYFDSLKDKSYDETAANKAVNKLISTGAFSSVTIKAQPDADPQNANLDIIVDVKETEDRSISTYAGVGSYEGGIFGASYTNFNYHGSLRKLELRGEYSGRGLLGEISINEPRFAAAPIQLNNRLFIIQRDYEGYDTQQAGAEISFTWTPTDQYATRLALGATYASSSTESLTDIELGPSEYLHSTISLSQTLDFRNSRILPSQGFYANLLLEAGNISGEADNDYTKFNFQSSYRHKLTEHDIINTRFSTGAIDPQSDNDLPIDVRLFSGGTNTQRAFDERELGPRSLSNDPLGGQAYWVFTTEYIRTITDPFKIVAFFDAGQVYSSFSDYGFDNPSYAAGLGLRIDLPIGPIRLEYGHNLNQQSGEPNGQFHFSIGASF